MEQVGVMHVLVDGEWQDMGVAHSQLVVDRELTSPWAKVERSLRSMSASFMLTHEASLELRRWFEDVVGNELKAQARAEQKRIHTEYHRRKR